MYSFKFRAECLIDVERFISRLDSLGWLNITMMNQFPDCYVTFYSERRLDELRAIIRDVPDGHVMLQTIQPAALYTGERDYELR
jgi:hypothetical protein